jgi:hypothetical protein
VSRQDVFELVDTRPESEPLLDRRDLQRLVSAALVRWSLGSEREVELVLGDAKGQALVAKTMEALGKDPRHDAELLSSFGQKPRVVITSDENPILRASPVACQHLNAGTSAS